MLADLGLLPVLGLSLELSVLFLQRGDDGGVGHGGGVPEVGIVGGDLAEYPPHDLARTGLGKLRCFLSKGKRTNEYVKLLFLRYQHLY